MNRILYDLLIIAASVLFAVVLVTSGAVVTLFGFVGQGVVATSFFAGMFFTSLFTTAPAVVVLSELALRENLILVSILGGLGAVVGDYLIFWFVRHRIVADSAMLMSGPRMQRIAHILKKGYFKRLLPILGAVIIASPFPDELGLALLGVSSINNRSFFLLSFSMNALGILLIGLTARAIVF